MSIEDLVSLISPPPSTDDEQGRRNSRLGRLEIPVPRDYTDIFRAYGPGSFADFLWMYQPNSPNVGLDLETQIRVVKDAYNQLVAMDPDSALQESLDMELLTPWGFTENGDILWWVGALEGLESSLRIAVSEASGPTWQLFEFGTIEWLVGVLSGVVEVSAFPDDFPPTNPEYIVFEG